VRLPSLGTHEVMGQRVPDTPRQLRGPMGRAASFGEGFQPLIELTRYLDREACLLA